MPVAEEGGEGEETKPSVDKSKERLYRIPFHKAKTCLAKTGGGIATRPRDLHAERRGGGCGGKRARFDGDV